MLLQIKLNSKFGEIMSEHVKFSINKRECQGIDCLDLEGYLDAHTAPDLENEIQELISRGQNKIIVNFSNLDYISSAGLGVFMAFIEDIRSKGGDIKLTSMKPKVFTVFDLLGFPMIFDIEIDDDSAAHKFKMNLVKKNEE